MDDPKTGVRISRATANQLASVLNDVAAVSADRQRQEMRETVKALTNQTETVNLGTDAVLRIRAWLREQQGPQSERFGRTDYLLVALGDTNELARVLKALRSGPNLARSAIPERLSRSEHPFVIAALAEDLLVEEPVRPIGEDISGIRMDSPSVMATHVINAVLVESPSFTDDTRRWAKGLSKLTLEKRRDILRRWWNGNKRHFASSEFELVALLSEEESAITGDDYLPQRRPIRKID